MAVTLLTYFFTVLMTLRWISRGQKRCASGVVTEKRVFDLMVLLIKFFSVIIKLLIKKNPTSQLTENEKESPAYECLSQSHV